MRSILVATMASVLLALPTMAATERGYMTGGGVGGVRCTEFLNAMKTGRLAGGFDTIAGLGAVNGFVQYVLGFGTAYNASIPGIVDIYAAIRPNPGEEALFIVEEFCGNNPTKSFDDGMYHLVEKLLPEAER